RPLIFVKECLDAGLNGGLDAVGPAIAEVVVLEFGPDHLNASLGANLIGRNDAGIGLEYRILGAERQDLDRAVGNERHAQIVERHDLLDQIGMQLGEVHRDVAAIGMVTVGTAVASRPPYRSRRALLTHRGPPSGSGVEAVTRQRVYRSDCRKVAGDSLDAPLPAEEI